MSEDRILPDGVREVSGTDEPLRAMMAGGEIPYPLVFAYNEWITWRSREGRRPRLRASDPEGTTRAQESMLWRTVMEEVHGSDWRDLVRRDAPRAPSREPVTEPGPDGDQPRTAEEHEDGRSAAGSSEISPVAELLTRLEEPYDPGKGPFDRYRERARRIVQQLQSAGATVDVRGLQRRMYQGECRAATLGMEPEEKRRWLRGQWKDIVTRGWPPSGGRAAR